MQENVGINVKGEELLKDSKWSRHKGVTDNVGEVGPRDGGVDLRPWVNGNKDLTTSLIHRLAHLGRILQYRVDYF